MTPADQERQRLQDARNPNTPWKKWGPYLSERQWGTVREDYSENGNEFTVECPTGSGRQMNLYQIAEEISGRLARMFLKGKDGRRPVNGGEQKLQQDPHWCDYLQFYEYFHGDTGAGLGASHQTGWTGFIARALHLFATTTAEQVLQLGKGAAVVETDEPVQRAGKRKSAVTKHQPLAP
jgi:hypothetical protein